MKFLIIFSLPLTLVFASLEPSGYRPPDSGILSNRYLPSSNDASSTVLTPESHYLPAHYQNPTSPNVIPNSQYLPSNRDSVSPHSTSAVVAMPSVQYLPTGLNQPAHSSATSANILSHYHHDHDTTNHVKNSLTGHHPPSPNQRLVGSSAVHSGESDVISSLYLPPSQRTEKFTQAIPSSNYLPANKNQHTEDIDKPSASIKTSIPNIYTMSNKFSNTYAESTGVTHDKFSGYSNSESADQSSGPYDPANNGYPRFAGYDNGPDTAKHDFEYAVKDEFGNDFSHKETQNGDDTQGVYTVLLPDGRKQIVHYTANSEGYQPSITYEDTAARQSGYDQGYKY